MRKTKKKLLAILLSAAMLTGSVCAPEQTETVSAAVKIKTDKTKVTVTVGKMTKVKVKNTGSRKIKAKVSNKKKVTVKVVKKQIRITGKKAGKTKLTLTAAGMKKCVIAVTVKAKANAVAESPVSTAKTSAVPGATAGTGVSTTPNQSAVPTGAAGTSATPEISGEPDPTNTPVPAKKVTYDGTNLSDIENSNDPLDIEVAEGVESLDNIFQHNNMIRSVKLPETIKTIGENEFEGCENLESVTIPKGLEEIGAYAFQDCKNLKEIYIPANVTEIKIGALRGCENLEKITVAPDNKVYDSRNDCNAIIQKKGSVLIAGCANTVIPEDVIGIGNQSFDGAVNLEKLVLPEGLQYIGSEEDGSYSSKGVFWRTGLKELMIPKSVIHIQEGAFRYCSALQKIAVEEGNLVYDSRNDCNAVIRTNENKLIITCLKTTIPDTVTGIGNYAYSEEIGEAYKYISIPSQITEIDKNAFDIWKYTTTTWQENGYHSSSTYSNNITFAWNGNTYDYESAFREAFEKAHPQATATPSVPTSSNVPSGSSGPVPTRNPFASGAPGTSYDPAVSFEPGTSHDPKTSYEPDVTKGPQYCLTLKEGASFNRCIPQSATSIVFTDAALPSTATAITVAEDDTTNGVVGWRAGRIFYVSSQGHGKVKANADMSYMFAAQIKNQQDGYDTVSAVKLQIQSIDFANLDTSGVEDMEGLFKGCSSLKTLNLNIFDTSKVTDMAYMFEGCSKLSGLDLSSFDTSKVTDMSAMFYCCYALTELDLSSFDTSNVVQTYAGKDGNYEYTEDSNETDWSYNDEWAYNYTINGTSYKGMFAQCRKLKKLTLDKEKWNTSAMEDMSAMFYACGSLTDLDVSFFNTENVQSMMAMFGGCKELKQLDLSHFNTLNVSDMSKMFLLCRNLTALDLSHFDTSNVTNMSEMFGDCSSLVTKTQEQDGLDISSFNTGNVGNMSRMFQTCRNLLILNLRHFDTTGTTTMDSMFSGCSALSTVYVGEAWQYPTDKTTDKTVLGDCMAEIDRNVDDPVNIRDTFLITGENFRSQIPANTTKIVFTHAVKPESSAAVNLAADGSDKVVGWSEGTVFYVSTQNDKTIYAAKDCTGMFYNLNANLDALEEIVFDNFDTSEVVTMDNMFNGDWQLKKLDVSGFNTSKVTSLYDIFERCNSLTGLDVSKWDTSNVTDMRGVFYGCKSLTELDVTKWNTANVTNMSGMFESCKKLVTLDLRNFDTQKVEKMGEMFRYCSILDFIFTGNNWKTAANAADMLGDCPGQLVSCGDQSGQEAFDTSCYLRNGQEFQCVLDQLQSDDFKLTKIVFTDVNKPENADAVAVSADGKTDKLVGWLDGTVFYVSSQGNGKIYANINCKRMFDRYLNGVDSTYDSKYYYNTSLLEKVTEIDLSNLDTSLVKNMNSMFAYSSLIALDLSSFDTSKVTDMREMFTSSDNLETVDLSSFVIDQKPRMDEMFCDCTNLTTVYISADESWNDKLSSLINEDQSTDIFQVKTR
ncbi:BspA family leucine-rich repeat surface protein [Jutongia sp.]|uniref:BspA family leucine-rich repeat surface protein n=1 Tax=Jutongia sp. TaxID=2944204 RepID=UPI003079A8DE